MKDDRVSIIVHTAKAMKRHNLPEDFVNEYIDAAVDGTYKECIEYSNNIIRLCNKKYIKMLEKYYD